MGKLSLHGQCVDYEVIIESDRESNIGIEKNCNTGCGRKTAYILNLNN